MFHFKMVILTGGEFYVFFFKDVPQMILRTSQVWEPLDLGAASQTDVKPANLKGVM
jgi:hypothetical protein